jgi:hypothetical protein
MGRFYDQQTQGWSFWKLEQSQAQDANAHVSMMRQQTGAKAIGTTRLGDISDSGCQQNIDQSNVAVYELVRPIDVDSHKHVNPDNRMGVKNQVA